MIKSASYDRTKLTIRIGLLFVAVAEFLACLLKELLEVARDPRAQGTKLYSALNWYREIGAIGAPFAN